MAEGESGLSSPQDGADSPHDPSFTCVLVHNIPSTYAPSDSEYITRCFREATSLTGTSLSTSDTRVVPTLTSGNATPHSANHAVITVDTSDIKAIPVSLELQAGMPKLPIKPMFQERARATFRIPNINSEELKLVLQNIESQGMKLSLTLKVDSDNIKVRGSCSQVHKFREYLVNLLTEYHLRLPQHEVSQPSTLIPQENSQPHEHFTPHPPTDSTEEGGGAAGGTCSSEESKVFTGLSKDVLLLMPKVNEGRFKMMEFLPEEGKVVVLATSEEEQEKCISQFQETYQGIIKNRQLKSGDLEVPTSFPVEKTFGLLDEFNGKYNQCHFSYDEKARVIRIVSMSSRQFDQAKKLISDRLAGKNEKKEAKGGGEGGKGATGKLSTKTGSSEVYEISKGRTLMVKRGDIVSEDATILVNAANTRLDHGLGVAGALNKATGGELQRISYDYTKAYGKVPVGGAALTKAGGGKLKCKWVIHAVGPIAHEQKSETLCSELIFTAISNSLIEAQKKNAASIVFPALSTGIYSVKKLVAANAIFQAILKFHYTSKNALKDIRIVILDEETYTVFAQHLLSLKATGSDDASVQSHGATFNKSNSLPEGYDTSSQGHTQPLPYSNVAAAGRGSALPFSGPALGTGAFGRGTSTTSTSTTAPPGFSSHSPVVVTAQPTGQTHSQPHDVLSTNNAYTTTSSTGGILKPATFNYGVVGGGGGGSSGGGGGAGGNEMGRGRGQCHGQQQSAFNGAVTAQLLTPAEVTDLMSKGISRSSSHDENYSTPPTGSPSSITPPTNEEGATPGDNKGCSICLEAIAAHPVTMNCCQKVFCKSCIDKALEHSSYCPNCRKAVREVKGNQPDGTMGYHVSHSSLPGYEGAGTIVIKYTIPSGIQTAGHPNPGQRFHGTSRDAYLPNTHEGQEILALLKKAFDARLIFTVGTSHTTGKTDTVVWNDIHHKTTIQGQPYGYPDPDYLMRVREELKAKGIQ